LSLSGAEDNPLKDSRSVIRGSVENLDEEHAPSINIDMEGRDDSVDSKK